MILDLNGAFLPRATATLASAVADKLL